jgi:hypothetical protein
MRDLGDILYNFHWVVPGDAARAAQAWAGGVGPFLEKRGIKAVINLRGRNDDLSWWENETARKLPTRALLMQLVSAFDEAPRPFMLKCSGGQDRTSFAAALYLIHRGGWSAYDVAAAQYARFPYLHFPKAQQRWLRPFLDFAREDARGAPLADWIAASYTPEKLQVWLAAHNLADSHGGIFSVPTRSPHQW